MESKIVQLARVSLLGSVAAASPFVLSSSAATQTSESDSDVLQSTVPLQPGTVLAVASVGLVGIEAMRILPESTKRNRESIVRWQSDATKESRDYFEVNAAPSAAVGFSQEALNPLLEHPVLTDVRQAIVRLNQGQLANSQPNRRSIPRAMVTAVEHESCVLHSVLAMNSQITSVSNRHQEAKADGSQPLRIQSNFTCELLLAAT